MGKKGIYIYIFLFLHENINPPPPPPYSKMKELAPQMGSF